MVSAGDEAIDEVDAGPGMTGEAKLQGTLMYMSPEQIERNPHISFESDIYSLGAVLYEILAGVTPFQGDVVHKLLDNIRHDAPADVQSVTQYQMPQGLSALVMQCLRKDPQDRPNSIEEIIRTIRAGI